MINVGDVTDTVLKFSGSPQDLPVDFNEVW